MIKNGKTQAKWTKKSAKNGYPPKIKISTSKTGFAYDLSILAAKSRRF
jgi:hypothetical protein